MQCKKCGREIIGEIQRYCNDCKKEIERKHIRNTKILANQDLKPIGLNKVDQTKQEELLEAAREAVSNATNHDDLNQNKEAEDLGATKIFTIPKELLKDHVVQEASEKPELSDEACLTESVQAKSKPANEQLEEGAESVSQTALNEDLNSAMVEEVSPSKQSRVEYIQQQREARKQLIEEQLTNEQVASTKEEPSVEESKVMASVSQAEKEGLLMENEQAEKEKPKKKGCLWRILELIVILAGIAFVFVVGCAIGFKLLPMLPF